MDTCIYIILCIWRLHAIAGYKSLREEEIPMFVAPEMKVVEFDVVDVITTSCPLDEPCDSQLPVF